MRLAILSDTYSPVPGTHGLGVAVHSMAEGFRARGHDVTLFAPRGSSFSGKLVMPCDALHSNEHELALAAVRAHQQAPFDAIYEHTHKHDLARLFPNLPVISHYHDRWQAPTPRMVLCSEGQRALMGDAFKHAWVVHNALDADSIQVSYRHDGYVLWVGVFREYKQPALAAQIAAQIDMPLIMVGAGGEAFAGMSNVTYLGAQPRKRVLELMRGAAVYLQTGNQEACPMTNIEAGLSGTPIVAAAAGGNLDYVTDDNGRLFTTAAEAIDAICDASRLDRRQVRASAVPHWGSLDRQITEVEHVFQEAGTYPPMMMYEIDGASMRFMIEHAPENAFILDCGCGTSGYYALQFARWGKRGVMVEPLPVPMLRTLTKHYNVDLVEAALMPEDGETAINLGATPDVNSINGGWWLATGEHTTVPAVSPTTLYARYPEINAVKLDIEGMESKLLPCWDNLPKPAVFCIEYSAPQQRNLRGGWGAYENTLRGMIERLRGWGYTEGVVIDGTLNHARGFKFGEVDPQALIPSNAHYGNIIVWGRNDGAN